MVYNNDKNILEIPHPAKKFHGNSKIIGPVKVRELFEANPLLSNLTMFQNDMNSTFYDITRYKHFFNLKNRFSPKMTDNWINKEVVIVEKLSLKNNNSMHKPIKKPNKPEIRFKGEHVKNRVLFKYKI